MKHSKFSLILSLVVICILSSCDSKPKVIVEDTATSTPTTMQVNTDNTQTATAGGDLHQVVSLEVLQTEKYTYLRVLENNKDTFWIAASKLENAKVGAQYFYRGGLLKTNFESKEHNRVFDKVYLVSNIIDASSHPGSQQQGQSQVNATSSVNSSEVKKISGAVKLSDLFKNKSTYNGKSIIVSGKVVKVNNGIMGRNWVHIQDGTKCSSKDCDLTITTNANVAIGSNAAFEGKIILDKDFGSGYKYDILMEEAIQK